MQEQSGANGSVRDLTGLGEVARAIPPQVYERTTEVSLTILQQAVAPFTALTSGIGRYITQIFDNKVEVEKALLAYSIQKAVHKAKVRAEKQGIRLHEPASPHMFANVMDQAARETDPTLHEMWANLLASQLCTNDCHPHYVEVLSHFSPVEARLLSELVPHSELGQTGGSMLVIHDRGDTFHTWLRKEGEELREWTMSCELLKGFLLADIASPPTGVGDQHTAMLYLTNLGAAFLSVVNADGQSIDSEG